MSEDGTVVDSNPVNAHMIRTKIKEADLYASQCLFDEAREIYSFLLAQLTAWLQNGGIPDGLNQKTIQDLARIIQTRLDALEIKASEFCRQKALKKKTTKKEVPKIGPSISFATQHPLVSFAVCLMIALFFFSFLPRVKTVNNVDYFTLDNDPDIRFYKKFKEVFGNDEFFVIAFEKKNLFTEKNLKMLASLTKDLEGLEDVKKVRSLANVNDIVGGENLFEVKRFLETIPSDQKTLQILKKQAVQNPLYLGNLISRDARTTAIVVQVLDKPQDPNYRRNLLKKTTAILDRYRDQVDRFYLAGWTITNFDLSQYMKKDVFTFIPLAYFFIILTVWLFFRNLWLTVLAVANISLCVGSTMGLFGLTGITLNNVTSIVPPLVIALALCDVVHILSHMDKKALNDFSEKHKALAHVLKKVFLPSFFTTLTTAIGFFSLAVSKIPPIREFAYVASAGMAFEFLYSFFLLPPLILLFDPRKLYQDYETKKVMLFVLKGINNLVTKHRGLVLLACALIVAVASWYASKLRVETNLIAFFKKSSPLRVSTDFIEKRLGGVNTLDISLRAEEEDAFEEPRNLKVIETIENYLKSLPKVDTTVSLVDFLKDMNQSFHAENPVYYRLPETKAMVAQYLLLYDSEDIEDLVNSSYDRARIAVRISEPSSAGQEQLIGKIERFIQTLGPTGLDIRVTGRVRQDVDTIDALVSGQIYSLALAAGVILIVMVLALRSLVFGLISIVPTMFPIILNFGIMGAFAIPLDTGTAIISAVALGIVVDDTIHFLSEYRLRRLEGLTIGESVRRVIFTKGRPIISSSVILCIGFGVLVFSNFAPTVHFGILSGVIMITALVGDMILLPAMLCFRN